MSESMTSTNCAVKNEGVGTCCPEPSIPDALEENSKELSDLTCRLRGVANVIGADELVGTRVCEKTAAPQNVRQHVREQKSQLEEMNRILHGIQIVLGER